MGLWFTISTPKHLCTAVSSELVVDILYDYIKYAMGINNPDECQEYLDMKSEITQNDIVELKRIIEV